MSGCLLSVDTTLKRALNYDVHNLFSHVPTIPDNSEWSLSLAFFSGSNIHVDSNVCHLHEHMCCEGHTGEGGCCRTALDWGHQNNRECWGCHHYISCQLYPSTLYENPALYKSVNSMFNYLRFSQFSQAAYYIKQCYHIP